MFFLFFLKKNVFFLAAFCSLFEGITLMIQAGATLSVLNALNHLSDVISRDIDSLALMEASVRVFREIFDVDRAWLVYPCDPKSPACKVCYEDARPGISDLITPNCHIDVTRDVAGLFKSALAAKEPIIQKRGQGDVFGSSGDGKFKKFSSISLALKMQNDRPWLLEMHRCGHQHEWTEDERCLFHYAGQRLCEAYNRQSLLTTLKKNIIKRQKAELEITRNKKCFRTFFQNSGVSLWLIDLNSLHKKFIELKASGVTDLDFFLAEHPEVYSELATFIKLKSINLATVQLFEAKSREQALRLVKQLFNKQNDIFPQQFYSSLFAGKEHSSYSTEYKTFKNNIIKTATNIDLLPGEKTLALVSITDSSKQTMLETTLQETREQFKALLYTANKAILVVDVESDLIVQANTEAEELTGYQGAELIGLNQRVLVPFREEGEPLKLLFADKQNSDSEEGIREAVLLRANGQEIPVEVRASRSVVCGRVLVQGFLCDLREREVNNEHLQLLTTITEQTDDAVIITNKKGEISSVNPAFERISGYLLAEVIGKNPNLLKSGKHDKEFYEALWSRLKAGKSWQGSLINRAKNGLFYEEDTIITPIKNSAGKICNYVAVKRDKTRQLSLEKQVRDARRMLAIGTLAGGIAHDFNNILTGIMGYAELAQFQCEKNTPLEKNLNEIVRGADRAGRLIEQIRAFSRQTEKNVAPLNLAMVIAQCLRHLRIDIPDSIEVVEQVDKNVMVRADPTQVHQVIMNLCSNACQAMDKNRQGRLTIIVKSVAVSPEKGIELGNLLGGDYVCISIQDNGTGLSEERLRRIFEPYFTTKGMSEATGLGLSVVHGIVTDHGGAVTVSSEIGLGSCFTVYLPEISRHENNFNIENRHLIFGSGRVMVIDDEQQIVDYEIKILERAGYQVQGFSKSREALKIIQTDLAGFDLVVTDMAMPEITGLQLFREVKKKYPAIPVVLCTGYSEYVSKDSSREMGINGYLVKPFTAEQFACEVNRVLSSP